MLTGGSSASRAMREWQRGCDADTHARDENFTICRAASPRLGWCGVRPRRVVVVDVRRDTHPGNTTIDEGFHPLLGYRSQMACEEDLEKFKQARAGQAPHPAIRFITDHCFPANIDPRVWKGKCGRDVSARAVWVAPTPWKAGAECGVDGGEARAEEDGRRGFPRRPYPQPTLCVRIYVGTDAQPLDHFG